MLLKPIDRIICRSPALPVNIKFEDSLELLTEMIKQSSEVFYSLVTPINLQSLETLPENIKFSLWKYYNRAKYRATPYGTFAAITPMSLTNEENNIIIENAMEEFHLINWHDKDIHKVNSAIDQNCFITNSTVYYNKAEFRFISFQNDSFELRSAESSPELIAILLLCRNINTFSSISILMQDCFGMCKSNILKLINQLIEIQLLIPSSQPNITGKDYFERIGKTCLPNPNNYITAKRKLLFGGLNRKFINQLPQLIEFLYNHLPQQKNMGLEDFKQDFTKRFDQQEISLAIAMDPELGIGYGNFAEPQNQNSLINELNEEKLNEIKQKDNQKIFYGKLESFLLEKMIEGGNIKLEEFEFVEQKSDLKLPNTIGILFELYEGNPVLLHSGGCTANALLGRFTHCSEEIMENSQEIAKIESKSNKEVIFFDIAYHAEKKIDNVNRRLNCYTYELPILSWSTTDSPLNFEDIMISIINNEIILRSKKLEKRLIPRIATAYNYSRSDLSCYRFLCDLQHQSLATNFMLKLSDVFPNLKFYPRLSYNGIILSPAMWLVPKGLSLKDRRSVEDENLSKLRNWFKEKNIYGLFRTSNGDQSLTYDVNNERDLIAFQKYFKKHEGTLYITEALISYTDQIKDEKGNRYHPQYIVNYYHNERIYSPISFVKSQPIAKELPGGDWLYFKIYLHPNQGDRILQLLSRKVLKINNQKIKKWFYIRYTDSNSHLRLRIQLSSTKEVFPLLTLVHDILNQEVKDGFVYNLILDTYNKESDRYGYHRMNIVETFFYYDSKLVLKILGKGFTESHLLWTTMSHLKQLIQMSGLDSMQQLSFVSEMAHTFAKEHSISTKLFKNLNSAFKNLSIENQSTEQIQKNYLNTFKRLLSTCKSHQEHTRLLADIIHMHVNRVFYDSQRQYETILYQYLNTHLLNLKHQKVDSKAKSSLP